MKKSILLFTAFIFAVEVFHSCKKSNCDSAELPYQVLTADIKTWLPYSSNADIVFEDASFQKDTIRLRNYFNGDDDIWRGDECESGSGQFIRCDFIDLMSDDTIKAETGYTNLFSTSRKGTYVNYDDDVKDVTLPAANRKFEHLVILNDKSFADCIWVECVSSDNCNSSGITKYYFAKNKGLIAYVRNDVLWTLK